MNAVVSAIPREAKQLLNYYIQFHHTEDDIKNIKISNTIWIQYSMNDNHSFLLQLINITILLLQYSCFDTICIWWAFIFDNLILRQEKHLLRLFFVVSLRTPCCKAFLYLPRSFPRSTYALINRSFCYSVTTGSEANTTSRDRFVW